MFSIFKKDRPWSNRSMKKIDRDRMDPVDLSQRSTGSIRSVSKSNWSFDHKNDRFDKKKFFLVFFVSFAKFSAPVDLQSFIKIDEIDSLSSIFEKDQQLWSNRSQKSIWLMIELPTLVQCTLNTLCVKHFNWYKIVQNV